MNREQFRVVVNGRQLDEMGFACEAVADELQRLIADARAVGLDRIADRLVGTHIEHQKLWDWVRAMGWVAENLDDNLDETRERIRADRDGASRW